ncbi:MAG: 2Fe-2S iron-sulfur cluster-binding protein [Gemmatimonadales bacterium]
MGRLEFEGRPIETRAGDSIASALFRAGVRVFSRSFKYRRRRSLYCLTGDCPNCLVSVNGEPAVRACVTDAADGLRVARKPGWPSPELDLLAGIRLFKRFLPVGFYYKTFMRPRWLWRVVERLIRRMAGVGPVPLDLAPAERERRSHHPGLLVVGAGPAGLAAALAGAERGASVLLVDEGRIGERLPTGTLRTRVEALAEAARAEPRIRLLERATAVGLYEGPLVPVNAPDALHLVFPKRVVVATGAVERHGVFPGSDLPGVWLGRGAARMAGGHGVPIGKTAVLVASSEAGLAHLDPIRRAGTTIAAVVVPSALAAMVPEGVRAIGDGAVVEAVGRSAVRAVVVNSPAGRERIACDALVLSLGLIPRDGLLRQARPDEATGAGDVIAPGASLDDAIEAGRAAGAGTPPEPLPPAWLEPCRSGFVCLCEDVEVSDLEQAWEEGFQSTELLKRYSTVTMGPCQGALCHAHLRSFVHARGGDGLRSGATTARPPARPVKLEDIAAGARYPLEHHTGLHDRQLEQGAVMEWAGAWKRTESFGDPVAEYWAVRQAVSVMDVGTLGKYLVAGPDATEFLERLYPTKVATIAPGRSRYAILLNEAGYLFDDGMICALEGGGYYLTVTSGGADAAESWFRDWLDAWRLDAHLVNRTATLGAINLTGPKARELLQRLCDDPLDAASFPYQHHRRITVAGVPCHALRVGFTGELSFELHHPRLDGVRLWDALLEAGRDLGIRPHGLEALRLLRLEKAHVIVNQDTDFDSTPAKLGLDWAVKADKPFFVGQTAIARIGALEQERALRAISFPGNDTPGEGAQLVAGDGEHLGFLTSSRFSPVLGHGVALGWVRKTASGWPGSVVAHDGGERRMRGTVVSGAFYDPKGERLRA